MEPLPNIQVDALLDGTRGSCFFTKLDLASSYHYLRMLPADRWKTSFRSQLGQLQWNVVPFDLQGSSPLLMRVMNQALTVGLNFTSDSAGPVLTASATLPSQLHGCVPGASGHLGRCELVYMDDCLEHSTTLEQHLLDVEEPSAKVLEIFRCREPYAKSTMCEFRRQEPAFWGIACRPLACQWTRERCSRSGSGRRRRHAPRSDASRG